MLDWLFGNRRKMDKTAVLLRVGEMQQEILLLEEQFQAQGLPIPPASREPEGKFRSVRGGFDAEDVEKYFDQLSLRIQELKDALDSHSGNF